MHVFGSIRELRPNRLQGPHEDCEAPEVSWDLSEGPTDQWILFLFQAFSLRKSDTHCGNQPKRRVFFWTRIFWVVHLPGGLFFPLLNSFCSCFENCRMFCQVQLTSQRERFRCGFRSRCQMNRTSVDVSWMRYGTETIPSQMRVCCNRNNLEKRFDKPGCWWFVEWETAANCHRLFAKISIVGYQHWEHVHYWSNFLVSWWHLHWKRYFFLVGAMAQNASTSTTRTWGHQGEEVHPNSGVFWKYDGKHMKIMAMIESLVQRKVGMFDDLRNRAMGWHSSSLMLRPSGEETRIRRFYQHFLEPTQWLGSVKMMSRLM